MIRRPVSATVPSIVVLSGALVLILSGCIGGSGSRPAQVQQPTKKLTVTRAKDAPTLALATSSTFFTSAPLVILADPADTTSVLHAATTGVALGVPVLLSGDNGKLLIEIDRLGSSHVLRFGSARIERRSEMDNSGKSTKGLPDPKFEVVAAPTEYKILATMLSLKPAEDRVITQGAEIAGVAGTERGSFTPLVLSDTPTRAEKRKRTRTNGPDDTKQLGSVKLPKIRPAEPVENTLVIVSDSIDSLAAAATAKAAGADLLVTPHGDPRASSESVKAIKKSKHKHVVGLGTDFVDTETLRWRMKTAATAVELPGGGQLVFPGKRYVALYGTPGTGSLGALGRQDTAATVKRATEQAKPYRELSADTVIPSLEIIATIASADAGEDGNYSNEISPNKLRPLVDAAHEAGQYVILDLQPGRSSFLEQARQYESLLKLPYVGLALDPEWNLGPDQVHLKQIGSTTAKEINDASAWLADLVRKNSLPQKMLVLHQFQIRMIKQISDVDQSRSELAVLVHADGQGTQPQKQETWKALRSNALEIRWWGWKNFYEKDKPMLSPKGTARVEPFPNLITYQ